MNFAISELPKTGGFRRLLAIVLVAFALFLSSSTYMGAASDRSETPAVLTNLQQVRNLTTEESSLSRPVRVKAVVNYIDLTIGELFVQDPTNGVFVFIHLSKSNLPLSSGDLVEIVGVTAPGDFAPTITRANITVLRKVPLPEAKRLRFDEFDGGEHEGQRLEVEGVVQSAQVKQGRLMLNVHLRGGNLVAMMREFPADWANTLLRAKVRLRGVIAAIFNEHRQALGVRMFVPGDQFKVLQAAPADPFSIVLSPLSSVGELQKGKQELEAVRVRASVIAVDPAVGMYLSDGKETLGVQVTEGCGAVPGNVVDVVGFPALQEGRLTLEDSICRKAPGESWLVPVQVDPEKVIPALMLEDASGYGFSGDSRYDMQLVQMDGILIQKLEGAAGQTWMLSSGQTVFLAMSPHGMDKGQSGVPEGSRVQLTGVCIVSFDQFRRGQSFRILMRTPKDVVVLARPAWWTWWNLEHAAWVVGLALILFSAAVSWIAILRRQVGEKTRELQHVNQTLRRLSGQDALTGIANRRKFDESLESDLRRTRRAGSTISLLMIDIDEFKTLNDEYGHQQGDECLFRVAAALSSVALRADDLVARYGGEEFAVILPWTDHTGAIDLAERMRTAVMDLKIPHLHSPHGQILTISVGVATMTPKPREQVSALVQLADRALYRSKMNGKNAVTSMEG